MTIYEIVKKLIGEIQPIGETNIDEKRLENLSAMIELVKLLLDDIYEIIKFQNRTEHSLQEAGEFASNFFDFLGLKKPEEK